MRWSCLIVAVAWACGLGGKATLLAAPTEKETLVELIAHSAEFEKQRELFDQAGKLEQDGEEQRAFVAYLALDGGESSAMRIARPRAKDFLVVLRREAKTIPAARQALIEADLLLATGEKEQALAGYRDVAKRLADREDAGWQNGALPSDGFYVEQPAENAGVGRYHFGGSSEIGSHRDNWLIRRFIALDAPDDARREYERVWLNHRTDTEPFVFEFPQWADGIPRDLDQPDAQGNEKVTPDIEQVKLVRELHRPAGFSMQALRFAMDYAQFLVQQERPARAKELLLEVVLKLDMDRSPVTFVSGQPLKFDEARDVRVQRSTSYGGWGGSSNHIGLSRGDFLRRTLGLFKTIPAEPELIAAITSKIDAGENRLRRVLARVHLIQAQPEQSLAMELEYLAKSKLDDASIAFRKATLFDAAKQAKAAIAAAERALELIGKLNRETAVLDVPDGDEQTNERSQGYGQAGGGGFGFGFGSQRGQAGVVAETELVAMLERLHAGQGEDEKSLAYTRRHAILQPVLHHVPSLISLQRKHEAGNQSAVFNEWLDQQVAESKGPSVQIAVLLLRKDWARAVDEIAKEPARHDHEGRAYYDAESWKPFFEGQEALRAFLVAHTKAHPDDARSQLELLDLDGEPAEADRIARLELLLNAEDWRGPGKGGGRRDKPFANQYEVIYRLMRLCVEQKQFEKLQQFALQLARRDKPFDGELSDGGYSSSTLAPLELANAALAIAIQQASTDEQLRALSEALATSRWAAARAQLARRMSPRDAAGDEATRRKARHVSWSNVPFTVELYASNENVLSLARDEKYVYAGHPWGVAVYDFKGFLITRIPLGDAARAIVTANGHVWVGTPKGLFRLEERVFWSKEARSPDIMGRWFVAHQPLDGDVPPDKRYARDKAPGSEWFDNGVYTLAAEQDELWIGLHRNVQVLNMKALTLRAFSLEEMEMTSWGGFDRIACDGRYVWADSPHVGVRRYDRETETWSAIELPNGSSLSGEQVRFTGIVNGQVWVSAYIDGAGHRPCRIDRETLAITPLKLTTSGRSYQTIYRPVLFVGQREVAGQIDKQLVFGSDSPEFFLDAETGSLKKLPESLSSPRTQNDIHREAERADKGLDDERLAWANGILTTWLWREKNFNASELSQREFDSNWCGLILPDGTHVLGHRQNRIRYEYTHEDRHHTAASSQYEVQPNAGGLFFANVKGVLTRVSSQPIQNGLPADCVNDFVSDNATAWLCTSGGAVWMEWSPASSKAGYPVSVFETYHRLNGLCANRVMGSATLNGKVYFATGYGNSNGGLAIFDPQTRVFTTRNHFDGLPTDKLESLSIEGEQLQLHFANEYLRSHKHSGEAYRRFPPALLDVHSGKITPGGAAAFITQAEAEGWQNNVQSKSQVMPFLGGAVRKKVEINEVTYYLGTRGMVAMRKEAVFPPLVALGAKLDARRLELTKDAKERKTAVSNLAEFRAAMSDTNLLYRTRVIATKADEKGTFFTPAFIPELSRQLTERELRLRSSALFVLARMEGRDDRIVPLLKACLADSSLVIRSLAAQELIRRRAITDEQQLREVFEQSVQLERSPHRGSIPWGLDGGVESLHGSEETMTAFIARDLPLALDLVLEHKLWNSDDERQKLAEGLGKVLRKHPAHAAKLLAAYDPDDNHNYWRREMACAVLAATGTEFLPTLQTALTSKDRVVRSNAARACGAIGDARAVPWLIEAADLESGLSRASIVWALGQLKAQEALPLFARLYAEAEFAEQHREQSGVRFSQQGAMFNAQMDAISKVDSLQSDFDEIKRSARAGAQMPESVDHEDLLTAEKILEAVEQIGPEHSFAFYRALAASSSATARANAAEHLVSDRAEATKLLKGLLPDSDPRVRGHAALSLIQLNDQSGEPVLLELLNSIHDNDGNFGHTDWLTTLESRTNPDQRAFAAETLRKLMTLSGSPEFHAQVKRLLAQ